MEKKTLVYQAYGIPEVMRQTQFSIISLLKNISEKEAINILIYTDDEKYFSQYFKGISNLSYVNLSKEQISKWRGDLNFVHRLKIEILIDAGKRNPGHLYYSDGDTVFLDCPLKKFSKVSDRSSLMHIAESVLEDAKDPLTRKIYKFTKRNHFHIGGNEALAIGPSTVMWNAGFIGISEKNKSLLPLVLQLTDQTYAIYQKHVMEQLAFSYILQTNSEISATDDLIKHYWDQKPEYQSAIDQFLNKFPTAVLGIEKFNEFIHPIKIEKKKKKIFWKFFRD
jgi:hypothetical protein